MDDLNLYRVQGLLKTNYYDQQHGTIPEPFDIHIEAPDEQSAAELVRHTSAVGKNRLAQVRKVTEVTPKSVPGWAKNIADGHNIAWDEPWYEQDIVAFDVETTGLDPESERIIEIGWAVYDHSEKEFTDPQSFFVNPEKHIPDKLTDEVHGISDADVKDAPTFEDCVDQVREIFGGSIVVAQNRGFDIGFMHAELRRANVQWSLGPSACTLELGQHLDQISRTNLKALASYFQVDMGDHHRAGDDAKTCGDVFLEMTRLESIFLPPCTTWEFVQFFDRQQWPNDQKSQLNLA